MSDVRCPNLTVFPQKNSYSILLVFERLCLPLRCNLKRQGVKTFFKDFDKYYVTTIR